MNQNVAMHLPMDPGLRERFQQAAAREHRPPAQVLQRLMQDYVMRHAAEGEPPHYLADDRSPDDLLERQYGWKDSAFGAA